MQSSTFPRRILIACTASLAMQGALAAELGDISVQSYVGQPLSADIELTSLAPDEIHGVTVRLAPIDVYQGGGITMDPALQGLKISQLERDGRRFMHVSTQQAITAGHVHLYFLLGTGARAIVRLGTVWLAPVPALAQQFVPAKPLVPSMPSMPPPDAAALAAQARAEGMLRPPAVFVPSRVAAPVTPPVTPSVARPAAAVRSPLRRAIAPAATCAPQADTGQTEACLALDKQNVVLNDKLAELEGKIGALQKALAVPVALPPVPAVAPGTVISAAPPQPLHAKPKALHAAPEVKEKKTAGSGLWWLGIGTLLFLLFTAAIIHFIRKRKEPAGIKPPSKYWTLLRRPFRRKSVPVLTEAVEDVEGGGAAEEAAQEPEAEPGPGPGAFSR